MKTLDELNDAERFLIRYTGGGQPLVDSEMKSLQILKELIYDKKAYLNKTFTVSSSTQSISATSNSIYYTVAVPKWMFKLCDFMFN